MASRRPTVVVCGGGMSGLTSAVSAAESGADVTLVEKGPEVGGSAALSGGFIWTFAKPDDLDTVIPLGNRVLQGVVQSSAPDGRRWLRSHGVEMDEPEHVHVYGLGQQTNPPQMLGSLLDSLLRLGGTVHTDTALEELVVDGGRVTGVLAATADGGTRTFDAGAVIMATGGFQGNPQLVTRYLGSPDHLYLRGNPWSTGDAFLAATQAGAAPSAGLHGFYGHSMTAPPARFRPLEFRDVSQYYGPKGVALNLAGLRFADESVGTGEEVLNQALSRQREGRGFYVVDQEVARTESRHGGPMTHVIIDRARSRGGPFAVADTLDELCLGLGAFGVPPEAAARTLEEFNAACERGAAAAAHLTPPRTGNLFPLRRPPFFAVGVKASITFTTGGVAVDHRTRVLRRAGSSSLLAQSISELSEYREVPLGGLFAAGCDVGNVHHGSYMGGLATALTTGRVAGREAAAFAAQDQDRAADRTAS